MQQLGGVKTEKENETALLAEAKGFYDEHGYTVSDGDFSSEITAIAVPVWDSFEKYYAYSLNASVPRALTSEQELVRTTLKSLQQLAQTLAKI